MVATQDFAHGVVGSGPPATGQALLGEEATAACTNITGREAAHTAANTGLAKSRGGAYEYSGRQGQGQNQVQVRFPFPFRFRFQRDGLGYVRFR